MVVDHFLLLTYLLISGSVPVVTDVWSGPSMKGEGHLGVDKVLHITGDDRMVSLWREKFESFGSNSIPLSLSLSLLVCWNTTQVSLDVYTDSVTDESSSNVNSPLYSTFMTFMFGYLVYNGPLRTVRLKSLSEMHMMTDVCFYGSGPYTDSDEHFKQWTNLRQGTDGYKNSKVYIQNPLLR